MKKVSCLFWLVSLLMNIHLYGQSTVTSLRAQINRNDGLHIVFNIDELRTGKKISWVIKNADERIAVKEFKEFKDSLIVIMPFFGAELYLKKNLNGYSGQWKKAGSKGDVFMPIEINKSNYRYKLPLSKNVKNLSGRWRAAFKNSAGETSDAIAELKQAGNKLTGSILTTTGDYRFLEGVANGDSLVLSTFDGTHAFFFSAKVNADGTLTNGVFASGPTSIETWEAKRDANVELDETDVLMKVKDPSKKLSFAFPDLNGNIISTEDSRFKGKVLVVQIMGSWCPNCMDETAFLSKYYHENKNLGMEVIGLAYEYTTDIEKAKNNLLRFKNRFNVEYPMLITGVISSDPLRTEKTLPIMTPIKAFPSMIIIGKDGLVKKTHAGYSGPATGVHHEKFKAEFDAMIKELTKEN